MPEPTLYQEGTNYPDDPLPPRSAMHRDTPAGSRLAIANAYAVGRLKEVVPVERCEHGNKGRHIIMESIRVEARGQIIKWDWCLGAGIGDDDGV